MRVWKDGLASGLAHDHVIEATSFGGWVDVPAGTTRTAAIRFEVDARSLRPDRPALRQRVGLAGLVPEADRATVATHMLGSSQLDAARFPKIGFVSTSALSVAPGVWDLQGLFTLHGVTRPVRTRLMLSGPEGRPRATGSFRFTTSSFGFRPYEALGGLIRNKDEVEIRIDLGLVAAS